MGKLKLGSILRARCPACDQACALKDGGFAIRPRCPVCDYNFYPEPGFYLGATVVGFLLTDILVIPPIIAMKIMNVDMAILIAFPFIEFFFVGIFLLFYSRILWLHIEYKMTSSLKARDNKKFKDLFSVQASDYAKFRPHYPEALFKYLASVSPGLELAWDCGTGNGQAAVRLADYFQSVIATDPSAKQLKSAEPCERVKYVEVPAEHTLIEDGTVDLITAAQAFHWFQHEQFFQEAKRVLKAKGVVAIWAYNLCEITPAVDVVVKKLYGETLGPYWEKERKLVEEGYRRCIFPLAEIKPPHFEMKAQWSFEHLIGYLGTWSSLQTYIKKTGVNPLVEFAPLLQEAWGSEKIHEVRWELLLRVGSLNPSDFK